MSEKGFIHAPLRKEAGAPAGKGAVNVPEKKEINQNHIGKGAGLRPFLFAESNRPVYREGSRYHVG